MAIRSPSSPTRGHWGLPSLPANVVSGGDGHIDGDNRGDDGVRHEVGGDGVAGGDCGYGGNLVLAVEVEGLQPGVPVSRKDDA